MAGLLDRERIVARPGFNRWLVPPAALAIHLSIGMAYGLSVFWKPLTQVLGSPSRLRVTGPSPRSISPSRWGSSSSAPPLPSSDAGSSESALGGPG
jgi:hypothetical protein